MFQIHFAILLLNIHLYHTSSLKIAMTAPDANTDVFFTRLRNFQELTFLIAFSPPNGSIHITGDSHNQ